MPRNVEIKARIGSAETLLPQAQAVAGVVAEVIDQDDTFFHVPQGRLKLRQFADGTGELIHYHRPDTNAARASDYLRVAVPQPAALRDALARACGVRGRVHKRRWLVLHGPVRIHIDRVHGLGDFMELEVVLQPGQTDADGQTIAEALMHTLGLADAPRVAGAYLDLLAAAAPSRSGKAAAG